MTKKVRMSTMTNETERGQMSGLKVSTTKAEIERTTDVRDLCDDNGAAGELQNDI
jgi:hypothetical protein